MQIRQSVNDERRWRRDSTVDVRVVVVVFTGRRQIEVERELRIVMSLGE
jgi:hypothetical protein